MAQSPIATTSSSNYQVIFDNALDTYKRKTKKDLRSHPLLAQLEACDSPDAILTTLQQQIIGDDIWAKWLNPTVNVLYTFSTVFGGGISLVYPPAGVIFTGIGVLLSTAAAVSASKHTLADVFERIENFLRRLETYIEIPPTAGMTDVIVKIMVEVLSILAIATKEIKQSRAKKYMKRLVGRTDMEDALRRLDRLTQEEARMAAAQGLKATHEVDDKVQGVDERVKGVDNKIDVIINDGEIIREEIQQVVIHMDDQNRDQIRRDLQKWLSPPDPSVNYNTASDSHHEGTATWFTESTTFADWKASGLFLWVHGKPGSGKSVLSSSTIKDIENISNPGSAHLAYFFFDFKDTGKQDVRALLSSLVIQLGHQSDSFCDILFGYYSTHQSGSRQPSDRTLEKCLEDMLRAPEQVLIYLIIDALDECPNTTGIPTPRDKVLALIERLVKLELPNLRLCTTSRPEVDIRMSFEPLTSNRISLHDQSGQKKDIADFVCSVVYSDKNMRRWRDDDKKMVVEALTERVDGMFRWIFCQLEMLRQCLPASVRRILAELPETLDETYERILSEIPKSNRVHAHRLLQCLTVAIRPLDVEELAEVLAVEFDASGGTPKLREDLRWEDQEQAVLTACSSLIAVVEDNHSRVVQFSHFSVKEFLTSDRLATSKTEASRYHHIRLREAHTIMAQACLSVLLRLDHDIDVESIMNFPLAEYAAERFGDHVEFEDVSSHIRGGIDDLLDGDKPYLAAWLWMRAGRSWNEHPRRLKAVPLYYVATLGYLSLVRHLILKHPEDVNSRNEDDTPLHGALHRRQVEVLRLLLDHCVDVDVRDSNGQSPLHLAVDLESPEATRMLIEHNADINARDNKGHTPLYRVVVTRHGDGGLDVARFLLDHGADVDAKVHDDSTLLHAASFSGSVKTAQLLLERGACIHVKNKNGRTPLHRGVIDTVDYAADYYFDTIRFLLEHGADVDAQDTDHSTPLHIAARSSGVRVARLLLEHGASVHLQTSDGQTPLQVASMRGHAELTQLLLEHSQSERK